MPTAVPIRQPLDSYLNEVVRTLKQAVDQGVKNLDGNEAATKKAIDDCEEILDVIMDGNVQEWVAA